MCVKLDIPVQLSRFRELTFFDPKIDWKSLNEKLPSYNWNADFRNKTIEQMLTQLLDVTLAFARGVFFFFEKDAQDDPESNGAEKTEPKPQKKKN